MAQRTQEDEQKPLALLCQHFYPELHAAGLVISQLAIGLAAQGFKFRVYCAQPTYWISEQEGGAPAQEYYKGVHIFRLPVISKARGGIASRGFSAISFILTTLWAVWRDRKKIAGVVLTTHPPFLGLVAVILKVFSGLDYVTIVHDVYPDVAVGLGVLKPTSPVVWLWERVTRMILARSSEIIVIGQDMKEVIEKKNGKGSPKKIEVIPNWADEGLIKPIPIEENLFVAQHNLNDKFVVLYSGRMGRTHNLEPLVEAAEILKSEPAILFLLIGDGAKLKILKKMVEEKQLSNVQFLPYQPLETLPMSLSAASISVVCLDKALTGFVVPSKSYGILASGRPILGFFDLKSEIGQTIIRNKCGIVLEDPDGEQVANKILELKQNPDLLCELGQNGRNAFLENFTLAASLVRYEKIFRRVFYENKL